MDTQQQTSSITIEHENFHAVFNEIILTDFCNELPSNFVNKGSDQLAELKDCIIKNFPDNEKAYKLKLTIQYFDALHLLLSSLKHT